MCDQPVSTRVLTEHGGFRFQEYSPSNGAYSDTHRIDVEHVGVEYASLVPDLRRAPIDADFVIIAPPEPRGVSARFWRSWDEYLGFAPATSCCRAPNPSR